MFFRMTTVTASALAVSSFVNADIIYNDIVLGAFEGDSASFEVNGFNYEFGIVDGGPLDYAYVTTTSENAGVFIPVSQITNPSDARNFSEGENIGTLTTVLDQFPLGNGTENINLNLYNWETGAGNFVIDETGYVGFGFGSGVDFNYGWMKFTVSQNGESKIVNMTGWAYNDEVNGSITVGEIPAPGVVALLAIGGLAARRRRN